MKLYCVLFVIVLLVFADNTNGQSCKNEGPNYFSCGIPTNEFEYMRATSLDRGEQIQSNWCWAACVQMILNYHGLKVNQIQVVTKIYGSPYINQPANENQILYALSGWAPDVTGRFSSIHSLGGLSSINDIVNLLSYKWPLIVGLKNENSNIGHACVLTAIYYHATAYGIMPDKVVIRDPWPGNVSRQELSWDEFMRRQFMIIKVWVTRL